MFWSAPPSAFRTSSSPIPDTFRGGYDIGNIVTMALVAWATTLCIMIILRRAVLGKRVFTRGYLTKGAGPLFLIYIVFLGITLLYAPGKFVGAYYLLRYVVSILLCVLLVVDGEYSVEDNIKRLVLCYISYCLIYLLYHYGIMMIDFQRVCPSRSRLMMRCTGVPPFTPEHGTAGMALFAYAFINWIQKKRIGLKDITMAFMGASWLILCRSRAAFFAFVGVILLGSTIKRIQWFVFVFGILGVTIVAINQLWPEDLSRVTDYLMRVEDDSLQNLSGRLDSWDALIPIWWETSPLFGFGYSADKYFVSTPWVIGEHVSSHSQVIFLLIAGGMVGLLLFSFFFVRLHFDVIRLLLRENIHFVRKELLFLYLMLIFMTLQFPTSVQMSHYNIHYNMVEGMVLAGLQGYIIFYRNYKAVNNE